MAEVPRIEWIRALASPYLRGYRARAASHGNLHGWWLEAPRSSRQARWGFFLGYLVAEEEFAYLAPQPPECLVFAYVAPVGQPLHCRLVKTPGSLLRKTFEYIRWLTHRPPRFVFHDDQLAVMTRHLSMREWPREKYEHLSRNFFIETCCWLVRSGLVRRLLEESASAGESRPSSRASGKSVARRVKSFHAAANR